MIILLSGFKHSGKDTFAKLVADELEKHGKSVDRLALAYKLKKDTCDAFELGIEYANDQHLKEAPLELTLSEQKLGYILDRFGSKVKLEHHAHVGEVFPHPRRALQYIGTEVLRSLGEDIHCEFLHDEILENKKDVTIVTDARFLNEQAYFSNHFQGTKSYFIKRDEVTPEDTPDLHPSEKEMFKVQKLSNVLTIDNNSSLEELKQEAMKVAKEILWQE